MQLGIACNYVTQSSELGMESDFRACTPKQPAVLNWLPDMNRLY